ELALDRLSEDKELRVSVNVSSITLHDPAWRDWLTNAVGGRGVADRLIIEITESSMIEDFDVTRDLIGACKRLGVKMAMDDFGAGHTSFRSLRELAFDIVKIDGAFVQNIANSADDRFFVRTLINLAHHLGLKIVAEWVEDAETAQMLSKWGVDYFQGAHFGSAAPTPTPSPSGAPLAALGA
ncbi:MAG: EAL domain-containing protein, partial [Methylocystis sp.]|nr:EAL domain-containing protein [Methylocystis sp.]